MNNKGGTFLDAVIGIVILSILFLFLSNYTGFIVKTERNISENLRMQVYINNLIEYIYSYEDWYILSGENLEDWEGWDDWNGYSPTFFDDLEVEHSYSDTDTDNHGTEVINLTIRNGKKVKSYILERSLAFK